MTDPSPEQSRVREADKEEGLRDRARQKAIEVHGLPQRAVTLARIFTGLHWFLGAVGVIGAGLAGAALVKDSFPTLGAIAAIAGAAATGIQALLRADKRADHHWVRNAGLRTKVDEVNIMADADEAPTLARFEELLRELEKLHQPLK